MGKGSKAPTADPNIGRAALMEAKLGQDWLAISKQQYAIENVRNDRLAAIANEVSQQQLDASRDSHRWATDDRKRYETIFQPMQDEFVETAKNWDSKERQDKLAAEARADVINNAADASAQRSRTMASMGVDPTSGRYAGIERSSDTNTALAAAGAENNARDQSRKEAIALQGDAINMGNGLPAQAATSLGQGVAAGSTAVGTVAGSNAAYSNSLNVLKSGYDAASAGYGSQASILSNLYGQQLQAYQINQQNKGGGIMGTIGKVAGIAASAYLSDENAKTDKVPVTDALESMREMPVEEWTYKEGEGDEGRHIGPYAQDFKRATGKGTGKSIPVMDAIGVTMGAVQELDAKVTKLAQAIGKGRGISPEATAKSKPKPKDKPTDKPAGNAPPKRPLPTSRIGRGVTPPARGIERKAA